MCACAAHATVFYLHFREFAATAFVRQESTHHSSTDSSRKTFLARKKKILRGYPTTNLLGGWENRRKSLRLPCFYAVMKHRSLRERSTKSMAVYVLECDAIENYFTYGLSNFFISLFITVLLISKIRPPVLFPIVQNCINHPESKAHGSHLHRQPKTQP